jgi:hypothetical protein
LPESHAASVFYNPLSESARSVAPNCCHQSSPPGDFKCGSIRDRGEVEA